MRVYRDDQKFLTFRINALIWAIVIVFVLLAGSFWVVQGMQAERYRNLSAANALRELVMPAKRGLILDRSGQKILADNQPAYSLSLDRVIMKPIIKSDPSHRQKVVAFLAQVLGTQPQDVEARIEKGKGIPAARPFLIAEDLSMTQVASIQAEAVAFPELDVEPVQRRNYPYGTMAAHVMGFIGEVNDRDLAGHKDLKAGDLLGKRGVELTYDQYLRGRDGSQYWEYDSHGRRLREYPAARKEPAAGDNVYLTIDFELQRRAEQYFIEHEFVGSAVVLDPRNGEVLAMVSSPAFNPNVYSRRISADVWRTIASNPFKIEVNRAIQGLYSPGSVFKAVMAMAGLTEQAIDSTTSVFCGGSAVYFGRRFRCDAGEGHGQISVANALKVSCDIFFYNLGARLGVDRIAGYAHKLTFGEISRIDLDGEKPGLVPSTDWAASRQHRKWYPSETISVAIGQGPLLVTPLQVANMMAAISNGGTVYRPHIVRMIEKVSADGHVERLRVASEVLHKVAIAPAALEPVKLGLWKVVNEEGGTGSNARIDGLNISGKTGTVQVIAQRVRNEELPYKFKDHAWFASFAPNDNPEMVVVVFVEHGGHGAVDAAPLARLLYESRLGEQVRAANADRSILDPSVAIKDRLAAVAASAPNPGQ